MTSRDIGHRPCGIDVITRVHDVARELELDRALFSLVNQRFQPVHPIIATQGFDAHKISVISSIADKFEWHSAGHLAPAIVNVDNPAGADLRSKLLNVGIAKAGLRYIAFLDSDDYLYEHAYDYLVEQANTTDAAISFGGIVRKDVNVFERFVFNLSTHRGQFHGTGLSDLLVANFCPFHSFIIDRHRVADADLMFDTTLTRMEDYDFLLRICSKYEACFTGWDKEIGVYNWDLKGGGSIEFHQDPMLSRSRENKRLWNEARRRLWRRKCTIRDQMTKMLKD
jgi:hypothetical protein